MGLAPTSVGQDTCGMDAQQLMGGVIRGKHAYWDKKRPAGQQQPTPQGATNHSSITRCTRTRGAFMIKWFRGCSGVGATCHLAQNPDFIARKTEFRGQLVKGGPNIAMRGGTKGELLITIKAVRGAINESNRKIQRVQLRSHDQYYTFARSL
jgi:hypothetical protein